MLPVQLIDHLKKNHRLFRLIALRGFACREVKKRADAVVHLLDLARIKSLLEEWETKKVCLIGVVSRPSPSALLGAYSLFKSLSEIKEVISRGDDNLLRGALSLFEGNGWEIVGIHELMPQIMAPFGCLGSVQPTEEDLEIIRTGSQLLGSLSPYDVGQAAVLSGKRVLAIEGPEGTDAMLKRAGKVQSRRFFSSQTVLRAGLVKGAKTGQDLRIDMPAIGPKTVVNAKKSGLNGIAISAGSTLIIKRKETIEIANQYGLYLYGFNNSSS